MKVSAPLQEVCKNCGKIRALHYDSMDMQTRIKTPNKYCPSDSNDPYEPPIGVFER